MEINNSTRTTMSEDGGGHGGGGVELSVRSGASEKPTAYERCRFSRVKHRRGKRKSGTHRNEYSVHGAKDAEELMEMRSMIDASGETHY